MFENASIFILSEQEGKSSVYRLEVDRDAQTALGAWFGDAGDRLTRDREQIAFDGSYKPNPDELLVIEGFRMPETILRAVRDPFSVAPYQKQGESFPPIKAVFVGSFTEQEEQLCYEIAFQRFRREQYLSTRQINLFFDRNTFRRKEDFGIGITDGVDALYREGRLLFSSFYYARQIFDLRDYYREATDDELERFTDHKMLELEDRERFVKNADTWIRRKISHIHDSGVLEKYKPEEVVRRANRVGVSMSARDGKLVLPKDKKTVKLVLGFLDEEAYKGVFSGTTYLANSKRTINGK